MSNNRDHDFNMYLADRVNRGVQSFMSGIDRLDSLYVGAAHWVAEKWQNITYRPQRDLESILYLTGFVGFGAAYGNERMLSDLVIAGMSGLGAINSRIVPLDDGEREVDNYCMQETKPGTFLQALFTYSMTAGIIGTVISLGDLSYGAALGDRDYLMRGANGIPFQIGTLGFMGAFYVGRSDVGDPPKPKKKLKEKIKEKIASLLPQPNAPAIEPLA